MALQARPTTYRGIRMRSRLEASFAALLDRVVAEMPGDVRWEYEPRAFANEYGQYLPDFALYDSSLPPYYIEVKPTLEQAFRALERVQIIWDSEPDAYLWVDCGIGMFTANRSRGTRTWKWDAR